MQGDLFNGLALITLGVFSLCIFFILGERDITGPVFIILLGVGAAYASIKSNKRRNGENSINKKQ